MIEGKRGRRGLARVKSSQERTGKVWTCSGEVIAGKDGEGVDLV